MKIGKRDFRNALEVFALIAILVYVIARASLFLFASYTGIEKIFAVLLISAEIFVLIHGLGYVFDVLKALRLQDKAKLPSYTLKEFPSVAILVAARHESKEMLEETFVTLKNINYPNKTIYFLDDSSDERYKKEAEELSKTYNLVLFRRPIRHGAKAGIINDCLKNLNQKYMVIFDADQNPLPEFLNVLVPILEKETNLAFIQTPQFYTNIEESDVARAAAFQQAVFYEYICEGKSIDDSMFCCGTNVIFRTDVLKGVGGLNEATVTEDFDTSVKIHSSGFRSLYFNHVYTFGLAPHNLSGYFKQQFRWASGTITVFKKILWRFLSRPRSLKLLQWWEYLLSSSYYLIGFAFFFFMICPIAYLLFRIPSYFARPEIYILSFLPYTMLTMSVFYLVLKNRNYKIKDLFLGQLLGFITFPVYIHAAVFAMLGIKTTFGITEKTKGKAISYFRLWPQMALLFLSFIAFVWGLNRFFYEREPAILINGMWVFYHFGLLSSIFYFNRG